MPKRPNTTSRTDRAAETERPDPTARPGRTGAPGQTKKAETGVESRETRGRKSATGADKPASEREAFDRWREDQDLGRDEE